MSTVTIRLPEKLAKELDLAISQDKLNKSELFRDALQSWLKKREDERFLQRMKEAAKHLTKPWDDEEEDLWTLAANEALDNVEGIKAGEPKPKAFSPKRKRKR